MASGPSGGPNEWNGWRGRLHPVSVPSDSLPHVLNPHTSMKLTRTGWRYSCAWHPRRGGPHQRRWPFVHRLEEGTLEGRLTFPAFPETQGVSCASLGIHGTLRLMEAQSLGGHAAVIPAEPQPRVPPVCPLHWQNGFALCTAGRRTCAADATARTSQSGRQRFALLRILYSLI